MCAEQAGAFEMSVLRYPEIYGDYTTHSYDICGRLMTDFQGDEAVVIEADKKHRVIYVKDAVDSMMRVMQSAADEGVYLIPGSVYTERQILNILKKIVSQGENEIKELSHHPLLLQEIDTHQQEDMGFSEKYSLEAGLKEFCKLCEKESGLEQKADKQKSILKGKIVPILENVGLFLVVTLLCALLRGTWLETVVDFYLLYVVVIAIVYGCAHALLATLLTMIAKMAEILIMGSAFEYAAFTDILQILIVGVAVGYMHDQYKRTKDDLEDEKKYYQSELVDITRIYDGNRYVKEVYEKRLVNYENSLVRVYEATSRLDFWEPQKVIFQALDVASELMEMKDVAIYIAGTNSDYLRLAASSSELAKGMGKSIQINDDFFMKSQLVERSVYRNKHVESTYPSYACGIYDEDNLSAIVMLWTSDLSQINLHESNMLALICRLIERSMKHAAVYWNRLASQYIEGTQVLREEEFEKMRRICEEGQEQNKLEYVTLRMAEDMDENRVKSLYDRIASLVRQTDIIGISGKQLCIMLMNTNRKESEYVVKRFEEDGIPIKYEMGVD